ncbi:MAG: hypothetical protein V3V31_00240 [Methylococcales bacterium]
MKNVTITLEDDVAQWARICAAKKNTSVSKLLGNALKIQMAQEEGYDLAMQQYLSTPAISLKASTDGYPDRDSLHER